jgi:UDPglucose--hexose-1-phosphate uridylyltransferase
LREEWIVYAAHRQERAFLPPPEFCPLCPTRPGGFPTEIPFADFEIAVFENRFPSLHPRAPVPPELCVPTARGQGICEVVVYTPEHIGSLGSLPQERRELLVRVWIDRYRELYAHDFIKYVMPFENRGEEVGVTLHHPHGQIYTYPFVPPIPEKEAVAFRERPVLEELFARCGDAYTVCEEEGFVAFVPPFARYPYEVWVAPRRRVPGPWEFTELEIKAFARLLGEAVARYDRLFDRPFPYVMVLHAAPKGEEGTFHFHVEFYPPMRAPGKLKFLAGTELGAGTMVMDALPEVTAARLREVKL